MLEHVTNWLKALRSGQFAQAKKRLKLQSGFCCLGVLCEATPDLVEKVEGDCPYKVKDPTGKQPLSLMLCRYNLNTISADVLGFRSGIDAKSLVYVKGNLDDQDHPIDAYNILSILNDDHGYTFEDIADFVETNYDKLFKE